MASRSKDSVRVSTAFDFSYGAESSLLNDLEQADESSRGRLLRALLRAGFKGAHDEGSPAVQGQEIEGVNHGKP